MLTARARHAAPVQAGLALMARVSPTLAEVVLHRVAGYDPPHFRVAELLPVEARMRAAVRTALGEIVFDRLLPDEWAPIAAGRMEPLCTQLLTELPLGGRTAIDVGGLFGYYAVLLSRAVGPSGTVFTFEPNPWSFARLVHNLQVNRCENVVPMAVAVADRSALLPWVSDRSRPWLDQLREVASPARASSSPTYVPAVTLDDFADTTGANPDFAKIDVEGAEALVLEGGRRILGEGRCIILCETEQGAPAEAVFRLLREHGYSWDVIERSAGDRLHVLARRS